MTSAVFTFWAISAVFGSDGEDWPGKLNDLFDNFRPPLAVRERHMNPEEVRLDRFWREYYQTMARFNEDLSKLDWVAYYKNHGTLIPSGQDRYGGRIQFAPVVVVPRLENAIDTNKTQGSTAGPTKEVRPAGLSAGPVNGNTRNVVYPYGTGSDITAVDATQPYRYAQPRMPPAPQLPTASPYAPPPPPQSVQTLPTTQPLLGTWAGITNPGPQPVQQLSYTNSPPMATGNSFLSLEEIARLAQYQVSDEIIIRQIDATGSKYQLTADQIIWLKQRQVSDPVVKVLQERKPSLSPPQKQGALVPAPSSLQPTSPTTTPIPSSPGIGPIPREIGSSFLSPPYTVAPPDILFLDIPKSKFEGAQQIRGEHLVRPDGTISLGTFGSVHVNGMTVGQIKLVVEKHLSEYLPDPEVSVDVFAFNSKVLYVIFRGVGYDEQVFRLPITGEVTVLDAVGRVNGPSAVVANRRMWLARPSPKDGKNQILTIDWKALTTGGSTATNYQIFSGDRIYVDSNEARATSLTEDNKAIFEGTKLSDRLAMTEKSGPAVLDQATIQTASGSENLQPANSDTIFEDAFGEGCEELSFPIRLFMRTKGLALATKKFEIGSDQRVKLSPFSAVIGKSGTGTLCDSCTVRSETAYLTLDRPIKSLGELSSRKIVAVEFTSSTSIKITNNDSGKIGSSGDPIQRVYNVADLVVPIPDSPISTFNNLHDSFQRHMTGSMIIGSPTAPMSPNLGLPPGTLVSGNYPGAGSSTSGPSAAIQGSEPSSSVFALTEKLITLIEDTVAPTTWSSAGGKGSIKFFPLGNALVVQQTKDVHEQIAGLLANLRKTQEVQVAIEMRVLTVPENFAVRFDLPESKLAVLTTIAASAGNLTLPVCGIANIGFALTTDMTGGSLLNQNQARMFLEAARADDRTQILANPNITVLNGATASASLNKYKFFNTGMTPIQNGAQVSFMPQNNPYPVGINMQVTPVVSADRRSVRMNLTHNIVNLLSTDVKTIPMEIPFPLEPGSDSDKGRPAVMKAWLQQPEFEQISLSTSAMIPDGSTLVLGGQKTMVQIRTESEPSMFRDLPWVGWLFEREPTYSREMRRVIIMVTPRIITCKDHLHAFIVGETEDRELPHAACP